MTDTLSRLLWALPMVLVLGILTILVLRRVMPDASASRKAGVTLELQQSLKLSDGLQVHFLTAGSHSVLVLESVGAPVVQVLPSTTVARGWPSSTVPASQ